MRGWEFPQVKVPECLEKSHCAHNLAHHDEMFVKLYIILKTTKHVLFLSYSVPKDP